MELEERRCQLLRHQPRNMIPRRTRARTMELSVEMFECMRSDAFFVRAPEMNDLEGAGFGPVCYWGRGKVEEGCRVFLLDRDWHQENGIYESIPEELKCVPFPGGAGEWQCAHFYRYTSERKYAHLRSLEVAGARAVVIADIPGSGKSVLVHARALEGKRQFPMRWVELLELTDLEEKFKEWKESRRNPNERVKDSLFDLIGRRGKVLQKGSHSLEKKIFKLFCRTGECVSVFCDGFDEICPNYKETVMAFLEALLERTKVSVLVTTRLHESADLEKRLHTLAFNLVPLNKIEQVRLVADEWRSSLEGLRDDTARKTRIENLIPGIMENDDLNGDEVISGIVEGLKQLAEGNPGSTIQDIRFEHLALKLLNIVKSSDGKEDDFASTPLHSWMVASTSFESNFNFQSFKFQSSLYQQVIEIKVVLYSREKAKISESLLCETSARQFKCSLYEKLKKYSAHFFLRHKESNLEQLDELDLLRVGLLAVRGNKTAFSHRTFGEYFLSLWLLEHAKKKKVMAECVLRVLRAPEFGKVRDFFDSALTLGNMSPGIQGGGNELRKTLLKLDSPTLPLPDGEQLLPALQKCAFTCILDCREGILEYLLESAKGGEHLTKGILFEEADWDLKSLDVEVKSCCKGTRWNALGFCGQLINGGVQKSRGAPRVWNYLRILNVILRLTREHRLIPELKGFISVEGLLWWIGAGKTYYWEMEEAKYQFSLIFDFILDNDGVIGPTHRKKLFDEKSENTIVNFAENAFEFFLHLVESVFQGESCSRLLMGEINFLTPCDVVVRKCGSGAVEKMWGYVSGRLEADEYKREFLKKKDKGKRNFLFSASCNKKDPNVFPYVWSIYREVFSELDCKQLLLDSFGGVKVEYGDGVNVGVLYDCLQGEMDNGFLSGEQVTQLLLGEDSRNTRHLLSIEIWHRPQWLYKFQNVLLSDGRVDSKAILRSTKGQYRWLSHMCLHQSAWETSDADFTALIRHAFDDLLPFLESSPLATILLGGGGSPFQGEEDGIQCQALVVLLERQVELEVECLGREEAVRRLGGQWVEMMRHITR